MVVDAEKCATPFSAPSITRGNLPHHAQPADDPRPTNTQSTTMEGAPLTGAAISQDIDDPIAAEHLQHLAAVPYNSLQSARPLSCDASRNDGGPCREPSLCGGPLHFGRMPATVAESWADIDSMVTRVGSPLDSRTMAHRLVCAIGSMSALRTAIGARTKSLSMHSLWTRSTTLDRCLPLPILGVCIEQSSPSLSAV